MVPRHEKKDPVVKFFHRTILPLSFLLIAIRPALAQVIFTDNFTDPINYVTNGVATTIWDGIYLGEGEFNNSAVPFNFTTTPIASSGGGVLAVQSLGTCWENAGDTGFFLFKTVPGDFSAVVQIVTPFDHAHYNTAGLQVRAAGPNGNPYKGSENYVSFTRFDEFGYANYVRNEINGTVFQINPYGGPTTNSNYWLRIDRSSGTNFSFFETDQLGHPWINVFNLSRPDLSGLNLQVGLMHASFMAGPDSVEFGNFSLSVTNLGPLATPPAASLAAATGVSNNSATISWHPGAGSSGSLVVLWAGNSMAKEAPSAGITYHGDAAYGQGDTLPGAGYFVVYSGAGNQVTVTNLTPGTAYNVAVYSYEGSGSLINYIHNSATTGFATPGLGSTLFADNFNTPVNYLTNGVAGTIWDGIYLGAGEIANATGVGNAPGSVSVADADITGNNVLTLASAQTDWDKAADDGAFLFKLVNGDFDMQVHVLGPIEAGNFNYPGLMVRAFGFCGSPAPGGVENSFLLGRFDEGTIPNMLKNNVNGAKADTAVGIYPNTNYWLRIERVGSEFNLYEKGAETNAWTFDGSVPRAGLCRHAVAGRH